MLDFKDMSRVTGVRVDLMKLGVHRIIIEYSGSGDSGCFDGTAFIDKDDKTIEDSVVGIILKDTVEEILWDVLTDRHAGWENNDGGSGTFNWILEGDTLVHVHGDYYIQSDATEHEGWPGSAS